MTPEDSRHNDPKITSIREGALDLKTVLTSYGHARRDAVVLLSELEHGKHSVDESAAMAVEELQRIFNETPRMDNADLVQLQLLLQNAQILRDTVDACRKALGLSPVPPSSTRLKSLQEDDGA